MPPCDDRSRGASPSLSSSFAIKIHQKALVVSVNPAGVVTDVQMTMSGER